MPIFRAQGSSFSRSGAVWTIPSHKTEIAAAASCPALDASYRNAGSVKHGFRATASTLLNEMGKWHPNAIERQLGHVESNDVRRAYARGEYWDERVRMMQAWSEYLDQLRAGAKILKGEFVRA